MNLKHPWIPAIVAALSAVAASSMSHAGGCSQWFPGPLEEPVPGPDGPVYAMITWTPPGQGTLVVIGGSFTMVGGTAAHNIAVWNGSIWRALDNGANGPVRSLVVFNNQLIAGGEFTSPGRRLATWNGSTWAAMGDFGPPETGGGDCVHALAVHQGVLYAGGRFSSVNGQATPENCARYEGNTSWTWVPGIVGTVRALTVFDEDGTGASPPTLYIGGIPLHPAGVTFRKTLDGVSATDIIGPVGGVHAMTVVATGLGEPGGLYVGGRFAIWYHNGNPTQVNNIARFDGNTAHPLGSGIGDSADCINTICKHLGWIFVGGQFEAVGAGGWGLNNLARYYDGGWTSVGPGVGGGPVGAVNALVIDPYLNPERLIVGGEFVGVMFDDAPPFLLRYWAQSDGFDGLEEAHYVGAAAVLGSRLIIGGKFSQALVGGPGDPSVNFKNILTWDGATRGSLGLGTNGSVSSLLAFSSGSGPLAANVVVAGGSFDVVYGDGLSPDGAVGAMHVAQWTEPAFGGLNQWSAMGAGFNNTVHALERFNGWTVAGGAFTASGATTTNHVAKYVGSPPSWQPLTNPDPGLNGNVFALKAFDEDFGGTNKYLVIGGDFTAAPLTGVAANRILMRRENPVTGDSGYQALGAGFSNGAVFAIERYGSGFNARIYAAGSFVGPGINRIARLNNNAWEAVGNGTGFNGAVRTLKNIGGYLYAAGEFSSVDGLAANGVARWNGTSWSPADGGVSGGSAVSLSAYKSEVIVGGAFTSIGAPPMPVRSLARFSPTFTPWFSKHPTPISTPCSNNISLSVTLAPGYTSGVTYAWRRNGVPLTNGPTPHGSIIYNSTYHTLYIDNVKTQDAGAYDCIATNACANATSNAATLTVGSCCIGDIAPAGALDNLVDVLDLLAVINAWGSCPSPCPPRCAADIAPVGPPQGDCSVNVLDLLAVINTWGPCP